MLVYDIELKPQAGGWVCVVNGKRLRILAVPAPGGSQYKAFEYSGGEQVGAQSLSLRGLVSQLKVYIKPEAP